MLYVGHMSRGAGDGSSFYSKRPSLPTLCQHFGIDPEEFADSPEELAALLEDCLLVLAFRSANGLPEDPSTARAAIAHLPASFVERAEQEQSAKRRNLLLARERRLGNEEAERLTTEELYERWKLREEGRLRSMLLEAELKAENPSAERMTTEELLSAVAERDIEQLGQILERFQAGVGSA